MVLIKKMIKMLSQGIKAIFRGKQILKGADEQKKGVEINRLEVSMW